MTINPQKPRMSALICDDNRNMRAILRTMLMEMGFGRIDEAIDGTEALSMLAPEIHDMVITDMRMEPMDGLELTRQIRKRADDRYRHLPVLMVTGHADRHTIGLARDAGVTDILAKPLTVKRLQERLQDMISRPRPFVIASSFVGPCRRRRKGEDYAGPKRRYSDVG